MEIGKLYRCPDLYLMIYPSKETASAAEGTLAYMSPEQRAGSPAGPLVEEAWLWWANYLSKKLNCKVRFSEPNEVFMCLKQQEGKFVYVLFGEKQGWIVNKTWLKIERVL